MQPQTGQGGLEAESGQGGWRPASFCFHSRMRPSHTQAQKLPEARLSACTWASLGGGGRRGAWQGWRVLSLGGQGPGLWSHLVQPFLICQVTFRPWLQQSILQTLCAPIVSPRTDIPLEPVTMTLFTNRVFAEAIELRSSWSRVDPGSR